MCIKLFHLKFLIMLPCRALLQFSEIRSEKKKKRRNLWFIQNLKFELIVSRFRKSICMNNSFAWQQTLRLTLHWKCSRLEIVVKRKKDCFFLFPETCANTYLHAHLLVWYMHISANLCWIKWQICILVRSTTFRGLFFCYFV